VNGASDGVLIAQGGEGMGYVLYLKDRVPYFATRNSGRLITAKGTAKIRADAAALVVGKVNASGDQQVWIDGKLVGSEPGQFLNGKPADALTLGRDAANRVGDYKNEFPLNGELKDVRIYFGEMPADKEW